MEVKEDGIVVGGKWWKERVDVDVDWGRGHGATTPSHLGL
jgi:hypothetical protein